MDKSHVADVLEEIGTLLELRGENPFKSRAYHNASRIIAGLDQDLETLVREKKLTTIKGIGEGLSETISTFVTSGQSPYYEELHKSLPPGLLDIIRVQGVGPKRAKILYDKLKVKDIPSLEKACRDGKVAKLEGFGEKSQENILKGLAFLSQHSEQHRYDEAFAAAQGILAEIKQVPGIKRLSVCGSLRRHKEIIRDVDILVSGNNGEKILECVAKLPQVERVLGQGETKASVLLKEGIQVDVRVLDDKLFPYALHYFTGSKEHNIAMRQRAIQKGLKLSEYGLFKVPRSSSPAATSGPDHLKSQEDGTITTSGMTAIKCKDEAELFRKLGLSDIPPEMREDRGEIEAAEKGKLPKLIEPEDIRGVFHVHSTWSDGRASLVDMIAEAQRLGWEYVGISDHSKTASYAKGLTIERVAEQRVEIEKLRKKFKIHIFWGSECDILKDGSMDYPDKVLANYDFVIASVHSIFNLPEPEMTERIITALKNKYVTILGHMTGRLLLERDGYAVNQEEVLRAAADLGKVVELNASPHRFDVDWRQLPKAKELGVQISINPDAHSVEGLHVVPFGVGIARKGWLTKEDVFNALPLSKIITRLKKH
jgi:DNA polymerase (family 10)